MNIDDLDDHPDLRDLRLSKKDERAARADGRRRQRRAFGQSREPSFLRRHRTAVVSVAVLSVLVLASAVLVDRNRPSGAETPPSDPVADEPGLSPGTVRSYGYSMVCEAYRRGELAPSHGERRPSSDHNGGLDKTPAFDLAQPLPTTSTCAG